MASHLLDIKEHPILLDTDEKQKQVVYTFHAYPWTSVRVINTESYEAFNKTFDK